MTGLALWTPPTANKIFTTARKGFHTILAGICFVFHFTIPAKIHKISSPSNFGVALVMDVGRSLPPAFIVWPSSAQTQWPIFSEPCHLIWESQAWLAYMHTLTRIRVISIIIFWWTKLDVLFLCFRFSWSIVFFWF